MCSRMCGKMLPLALCVFSILVHAQAPNPTAAEAQTLRLQAPTQLAELTSSDGICDLFGLSIANDANTIAVGVPFYDPNGHATGAVYVYVKGSNGWSNMTQVARLTPSDDGTDFLGQSVAIHGDTIVAGGYGYTVGSNIWQGALYVFTRPASGWTDMTETAPLTASDGAANDQMGKSLAMTADSVVTAAKGAAYVFTKPTAGWVSGTQTAKLTASRSDIKLTAVGMDEDTVAASDSVAVNKGKTTGAAFVFIKPATGWIDMSQNAVLTPSDGTTKGFFGQSIAVASDAVVVGSPEIHDGTIPEAGAAYVFVKPAMGWRSTTQTAKLTASPAKQSNRLGWSVATDGNLVIAGATQSNDLFALGTGFAYVFSKPVAGWVDEHESSILKSSDGAIGDGFGFAVSISNSVIAVGAPFHKADVGAAYVF